MSATFKYNPFAIYVELTVVCPNCGTQQHLTIFPPEPNFTAKTLLDSNNSCYMEEECENCRKIFEIYLNNSFGGGEGTIQDILPEDLLDCKETVMKENLFWEDIPEDVYAEFLDPHVMDIAITLDRIDVLDEPTRLILYRSLYVGIIGAFEACLSDTLISKIMRNDEYKKKFVENSKQMQETKFSLSKLYEVQSNIDKIVVERLQEIIYHNLAVVSKLYAAVLGVKFLPYEDLAKSVNIRHHIVHRNGKDKQNNPVVINKQDVKDLVQKVSDFIKNIETQILQNEAPLSLYTGQTNHQKQ